MRKKTLLFATSILALLILFSCNDTTTEPQNNLSISGIIVDMNDNPIEGAIVQAFDSDSRLLDSDVTDTEAGFFLENILNDFSNVNIRISKEGFLTFEDKLSNLTNNKDKKINAKLLNDEDSCCGKIAFTVKDKSDSSLVREAEVRLNITKKVIEKIYTDENGYALIDSLFQY